MKAHERTCRWCRGIINIQVEQEYRTEWNPQRKIYFCSELHHGLYIKKQLEREHPGWPDTMKKGYIDRSIEMGRAK